MKNWFLIFVTSLVLTSCSNDVEHLKEQIMAGHDEVMPKMDYVKSLELKILDFPDSLKTSVDSLLIVKQDLVTSDDWMKQWMHEYDMQSQDEAYLKKELEQVNEMKTYINKSISNAEKIINSVNK